MRQLISAGTGAALAVFLTAAPAPILAQDSDIKKEIEGLKQGQQEILKQLDELKKMMVARQAPPAPSGPQVKDLTFNLGANPIKGSPTAKLTLVEFTDYQ